MSEIEWRPLLGYEGLYEVSNQGHVRSLDRLNRRNYRVKGRMLRLYVDFHGYVKVNVFTADGTRWNVGVHRLVMLAFVGPCPEGHEVLHGDGSRAHNHLSNLSYGTRSANVRDSIKHGTNVNAAKTHCKRGHAFNDVNTYHRPHDGGRCCRPCRVARTQEKRAAA